MRVKEIVEKVSKVYRNEFKQIGILDRKLTEISNVLIEVEKTKGRNITLADYNELIREKEELIREKELRIQYCEGMSCVRELLMDLGFYTDIDL